METLNINIVNVRLLRKIDRDNKTPQLRGVLYFILSRNILTIKHKIPNQLYMFIVSPRRYVFITRSVTLTNVNAAPAISKLGARRKE